MDLITRFFFPRAKNNDDVETHAKLQDSRTLAADRRHDGKCM